jgi:hypothetical protein
LDGRGESVCQVGLQFPEDAPTFNHSAARKTEIT